MAVVGWRHQSENTSSATGQLVGPELVILPQVSPTKIAPGASKGNRCQGLEECQALIHGALACPAAIVWSTEVCYS